MIQFAADVDIKTGKLEGRVEHLASSNSVSFHSLDELLTFVDRILTGVRVTAAQQLGNLEAK